MIFSLTARWLKIKMMKNVHRNLVLVHNLMLVMTVITDGYYRICRRKTPSLGGRAVSRGV